MRDLPVGTVTFLFTDIEGSTRLWEEQPDAMRLVLARHDSLLRAAIESEGGCVFKTVGDAFCAAFPTATRAIDAALAGQQQLLACVPSTLQRQLQLKVRMALHTGEAEVRDADYFGPPLNRVARLLAIGYGGQILVSAATQELVRDDLPTQAALSELGSHGLRDLGRPEQVFQLTHPALPSEFPPLRSLSSYPNNLPRQATSFVGREREAAEVKSLLQKTSLLSLTGSGGCGKTRLSLQVGADLLEAFADGVWLVELASLRDAGLLTQTVAAVLSVNEAPGRPLIQTLAAHLRSKSLLLIMDNCEHLVSACAELCDELMRSCPNLRVLVTSRESLAIAGEITYRVPSLSFPDPRQKQTPESVGQFEAVRLFIDRALFHYPAFRVSNENAPAVAQLCSRLDGIPLALELAAARVRSMPVEQIAARLDDRLKLLVGGSRTALPRQQTLRAAIDWSYDLLSVPDRALLQRLSIFLGGWCLEAAEAVCAGPEMEDWEVLDRLTGLVDKSLVVYEDQHGTARYRLLESVRHYALERLGGGEAYADAGGKHRAWFLGLAETLGPELKGPAQKVTGDRLETEHDNVRAALRWCESDPEGGLAGLLLAGSLWRFWEQRGYLAEGRARLEAALAHPSGQAPCAARGDALNAAGILAYRQGDCEGARRWFVQALEVRRAFGDQHGAAMTLSNLGSLAVEYDQDPAAGRQLFAESLALFRELGDPWSTVHALANLGVAARAQGEYEEALSCFQETLGIDRAAGDLRGTALALYNLGLTSGLMGDSCAAATYGQEALLMQVEAGDKHGIAESLEALGWLATIPGRDSPGTAARFWGAADRLREVIGSPMVPIDLPWYERGVATARQALGADDFLAQRALGYADPDESIDLALGRHDG